MQPSIHGHPEIPGYAMKLAPTHYPPDTRETMEAIGL